jgi:urease accessory protein
MTPEAVANAVTREAGVTGSAPSRLTGSVDLDFRRIAASGRTALLRCSQNPPLQVVRGFEREDGSVLAHLHNLSGGVLGGDRLSLRASVGPGAAVQLTTTGGTRIYRARAGAPSAVQTNEIAVAQGAVLEYVPDPIIPYAAARFSQRTSIHLGEGAGLFWWEILAPGRQARGETFAYDCVELITEITAAGRPIAAERMRLEPALRDPASTGRLGEYRYLASFHICRVGLEASAWLAAEERLRDITAAMANPRETLWATSALAAGGLVVRCLARHGRDAISGLHAVWREAKLLLYDREPIPPRKLY